MPSAPKINRPVSHQLTYTLQNVPVPYRTLKSRRSSQRKSHILRPTILISVGDRGSSAFLTPGSGSGMGKLRIRDGKKILIRDGKTPDAGFGMGKNLDTGYPGSDFREHSRYHKVIILDLKNFNSLSSSVANLDPEPGAFLLTPGCGFQRQQVDVISRQLTKMCKCCNGIISRKQWVMVPNIFQYHCTN